MAQIIEGTDVASDTSSAPTAYFGDEFIGSVGLPDNGDWFSFSGDAVVTFNLTGLSDDLDLQLYSWDGLNLVEIGGSFNGETLDESVTFRSGSVLTYFIAVVPYNSALSSYSLFSIFETVSSATYSDSPETIQGGAGRDDISAAGGSDTVRTFGGQDTVWGGAGRDIIYGGADNDRLMGELGDDKLYGDDQNDDLFGDQGNDSLYGGAHNDALSGDDGNDRLEGGGGGDVLFGGYGNDMLRAGGGDDYLDGDFGTDSLYGEDGHDRIVINDGADSAYGGNGNDSIDIYNVAGWANGDSGDDTLRGELMNDTLRGGRGNDYVEGGEGDDNLFGDLGDDAVVGGNGNDSLSAGLGYDSLRGGLGADVIELGAADNVEDVVYLAGEWSSDQLVYLHDAAGDVINGFELGHDVIDLYFIDANLTRAGDQRFIFAGENAPSAYSVWYNTLLSGDTLISYDNSGDGVADANFTLAGINLSLIREDFML